MQKGYSRSAEKAFGLFGKFLNGFSSSQEKGSPLRLCPGLLMQAVEDDITCHWETSLTHHQVAVNPLAGPHAAPPHRAKMRCNPPSMKSAFLSFSSTALPLAFLSVLSPPPTNNPTACPIPTVMHHGENIMKYTPAIKYKFDRLDRNKMLSTVLCSHAPSAPLCSRLLFSEHNAERAFLISNVGVKLLSVSLPLW